MLFKFSYSVILTLQIVKVKYILIIHVLESIDPLVKNTEDNHDMERDPADMALGRVLDRWVAAENIPCMGKFHLCHSRHRVDDDGGNYHGDSHNAMNRNMDLVHNFCIPFR